MGEYELIFLLASYKSNPLNGLWPSKSKKAINPQDHESHLLEYIPLNTSGAIKLYVPILAQSLNAFSF